MANTQHVDMLQQGMQVWNEWRKQNPDIRADLSGADLSGINLTGANLSKVKLSRANLSRTTFSEADTSKLSSSRSCYTTKESSGVPF
jgi:uncharacterized protein YjbI with pentapeptide repeats